MAMTNEHATEILQCKPTASREDIEKGYQDLHREFFLLLDQAPTKRLQRLYKGKLQEVEAAYNVMRGVPDTLDSNHIREAKGLYTETRLREEVSTHHGHGKSSPSDFRDLLTDGSLGSEMIIVPPGQF